MRYRPYFILRQTMSFTYQTIEETALSEFRDRGSRFIAYAYPLNSKESFKELLAALKKEHPKAVHHCFAYRMGYTGDLFRSSDDGEPSGTAGKPILGQIDSRQLTNTMVVVVRYFGGTLLGVPGLINAYKTVTAQVLDKLKIIEKPVMVRYQLEFDYTIMNEVMRVIKQFHCNMREQELKLFCRAGIEVPLKNEIECMAALTNIRSLLVNKARETTD